MKTFDQQVVLVTGGGQGIGRAISLAFAQQGAAVVIADLDQVAGSEAEAWLTNMGYRAVYIPTDVSKEEEVIRLVNQSKATYGGVDILINNAGIGHSESIYTIKTADFDQVLAVNLRGTFLCCKYAALEMKKRKKGAIINIASTRALMSEAHTEAYAASKGGLVALTHSLAVSLGKDGIRVNCISPGWIETGDWQKESQKSVPQHRAEDREQHPVGRVGVPQDIAQAALYLASDDSGFMTGQNLVIDGGMTIKMIYV